MESIMTLRCEVIKKDQLRACFDAQGIIKSSAVHPTRLWWKLEKTSSKNSDIQKYSWGAQGEVCSVPTVTVGGSLCSHSSSCRSRSCPSSPVSPASAGRGLRGARLGSAGRHRALTGCTAHTCPCLNLLSWNRSISPSPGREGTSWHLLRVSQVQPFLTGFPEGFEDLPI